MRYWVHADTFDINDLKGKAIKVLEEASEACEEARSWGRLQADGHERRHALRRSDGVPSRSAATSSRRRSTSRRRSAPRRLSSTARWRTSGGPTRRGGGTGDAAGGARQADGG